MQSVCGRCGNETSPTARFCRQCGAPLFVESDAAKAATRQYAPQNPPYPQYPAAPQIDANPPEYLKHDTARLYEPPSAGRHTAAGTAEAKIIERSNLVRHDFPGHHVFCGRRHARSSKDHSPGYSIEQPIVNVGPIPPAIPAPPAPPPPPPPGASAWQGLITRSTGLSWRNYRQPHQRHGTGSSSDALE